MVQQDLMLSGGSLRFERAGLVLRRLGHVVANALLSDRPRPERRTQLPTLTLAEAGDRDWDCVMVPGGATLPQDMVDKLAEFRRPNFGIRIHHILNDPSRFERFAAVNAAFRPDMVIFNSLAWPADLYDRLPAKRHHVLPGAVDTTLFRPADGRRPAGARWIVGGLASKNPEPLAAALARLPETVGLRLFGADPFGLAARYPESTGSGRLELVGILHDDEVCRYYHGLDCLVMTETVAGWSNVVAEAMAAGVPVICTRHGTQAIARDGESALVVDPPRPEEIAAAIDRLRDDPVLCDRLAARARSVIEGYSWERYARDLVDIVWPGANRARAESRLEADKAEAIRSFAAFCRGEGPPRHPLEIFLEVSNVCDMACAMCRDFSSASPQRAESIRAKRRGFIDADAVLPQLDTVLRHALTVHCFGCGEPTLHPGFRDILQRLAQYEVMVDFFTHGLNLDEPMAAALVDLGVHTVTVSLSGATADVYESFYHGGDFRRVLDGLRRLAAAKAARGSAYPRVEVNSLAFAPHVAAFDEFVALMAEHGVDTVYLKQVQPWPTLPDLPGAISVMRPWVEGEVLARAEQVARRFGLRLVVDQYIRAGAADEANYERRRAAIDAESAAPPAPIATDPVRVLAPDADRDTAHRLFGTGAPDRDDGFRCLEPFKTMFVTRSGSIRPCCFHAYSSWHLGELGRDDPHAVWNGIGYGAIREAILRGDYPLDLCGPCLAKRIGPVTHGVDERIRAYAAWREARFGSGFAIPDATMAAIAASNGEIVARGAGGEVFHYYVDAVGIGASGLGVLGWAFNGGRPVRSLSLSVDGGPPGHGQQGLPRPDVGDAFPAHPDAGRSGFALRLPPGRGTLRLTAELEGGGSVVEDLGDLDAEGTFRARTSHFSGAVHAIRSRPGLDFSCMGAVLAAFADAPRPFPVLERPPLVIVPVFGGQRHLQPFFDSLFRHAAPCRLVVVDDGNADPQVRGVLEEVAGRQDIVLLRQPANLGYVEAVLRGFGQWQGEHVVVVNTDTLLPEGWLPRLVAPLERDPRIASATPFTNAGTVCGFPAMPGDNAPYLGLGVDAVDAVFRRVDAEAASLPIPSGVGFCLAMSRHALRRVGFFERDTFGAGYGEENDWCRRAAAAGFTNVLVPDLYVQHAHGGSFPPERKRALLARNLAIVNRRHPDYADLVTELTLADPLAGLRAFAAFALAAMRHPRGAALVVGDGTAAERPFIRIVFSPHDLTWHYHASWPEGRFRWTGGNLAELPALAARLRIADVMTDGFDDNRVPAPLRPLLRARLQTLCVTGGRS